MPKEQEFHRLKARTIGLPAVKAWSECNILIFSLENLVSCVQFCARRPTYSAASRPASKLYDFPLNQRKVNKLPLWRPTSYTYELYTNDWQSYTEILTRSTDWKTYVKHWIRLEHSRLQPHAKQRIDSLHIRTRLMYPTRYNDSRGKRRAVYADK